MQQVIDIKEVENINLDGWILVKDTPAKQIYRKASAEKHLEIFETYTVEKNFVEDKLHGPTIGRMNESFLHVPDSESKVYLIENYHRGEQDGISQNFYEDGVRVRQEWKNDKLEGKWEEWYANGQKEKEKNYVRGELDGKQYVWYKNGQLKLEENFVKGIPEGESLAYLENGLLKRRKSYQAGKIEGIVYELWEYKGRVIDGGVYSETEYKQDIPHGQQIVFYPNGKKMREGYYQDGKEEGERIWWNTNGSISIKEYYKKGELEGKRILYDEQGELESTQEYLNGERIS